MAPSNAYHMRPGNPTIEMPKYEPKIMAGNALMSYVASWIEGCEIEGEEGTQSFWEPIQGETCEKLMVGNFERCK